ncbi:MAG: lipocalin family protein [Gemmobacter sp.]
MRALAALALLALASCASYRDTDVAMRAVPVDLVRYAGTWYEIERFPVRFQDGCEATTATYGVIDGQTLSVLNRCRQGAPDGPLRQIAGSATVAGPGRLTVRLGAIPFGAPYWVLWVAPDYSAAVVGVPQGTSGWILARSSVMPPAQRAAARAVLAANGYDVSRLIPVAHAR